MGGFWQNQTEAFDILNPLLELPAPSKEALVQLSSIPPFNNSTSTTSPGDSHVAFVFLQVASKHMPIVATEAVGSPHHSGVKHLADVVSELVGKAATFCQPRSIISNSGILSVFSTLYDRSISSLTVEFIQCALLAEQYRYVARIIGDDWPLPGKGASVELVLRYFYLRGLVHIGCGNLKLAVRCFWTGLSVPCDCVSAIAVDAWKKMILTKCMLLRDSVPYQTLVATPAGVSTSVSRFFAPQSTCSDPENTASEESSVHISAYLDLARAAHAGAGHEFAKVRTMHAQVWDADGNNGLIAQLASDMLHRQVIQFAYMFKCLPLCKMAAELGTSEQIALKTLKQIPALKFRDTAGIIEFETGSEFRMTTEDASSLTKLAELVRKLDISISKSSKYQAIKGESGRPPRGVDDF